MAISTKAEEGQDRFILFMFGTGCCPSTSPLFLIRDFTDYIVLKMGKGHRFFFFFFFASKCLQTEP